MTAVSTPIEMPLGQSELMREVGVAALAGALAGVLVGGLGSRVAMRISGAMSDQARVGLATTDNGNILGDITLGGTFALVIFAEIGRAHV